MTITAACSPCSHSCAPSKRRARRQPTQRHTRPPLLPSAPKPAPYTGSGVLEPGSSTSESSSALISGASARGVVHRGKGRRLSGCIEVAPPPPDARRYRRFDRPPPPAANRAALAVKPSIGASDRGIHQPSTGSDQIARRHPAVQRPAAVPAHQATRANGGDGVRWCGKGARCAALHRVAGRISLRWRIERARPADAARSLRGGGAGARDGRRRCRRTRRSRHCQTH
jgi:hypothetical protein